MMKRTAITAGLHLATLAICATVFAAFFAQGASGQIAKVVDDAGRHFFVNAEPPVSAKLTASKARTNIYLPAESSFSGRGRPAMDIGRDGVEKLVREAGDRHRVDPALVRAVIETESNWNPKAYSHKGAGGLMQLIPTTAQRYGAYDVFNPQQNIDAGVKHLKWVLQRYNGNLDLTGLTASRRIERRATMYRKYRMLISGRVRGVLRMHSSIATRSTKTSQRTAASYSRTNKNILKF